MKLFEKYPALKWLTNKYALTGLGFVIWMIFLDANNYFIHAELDQQIDNLENDIEFYEETLAEERELLHQLETNPEAFERYARENFGMHKEGETITIIEYETEQDE
jgi:cell division protein FtsB